jgi:hypothetical protein
MYLYCPSQSFLFSTNKQMGEKKQLDSPAQIKQDNRTSQEDTYSNKNKPTRNNPVKIIMLGTDHHCKPQTEIPVSKEGNNAKTRRNKRLQEKAAQNQTVQLSKPQPEIPVSNERDKAKTRRNKRYQDKAAQNQTVQLSKPQHEIPVSNERDKAKTRRKRDAGRNL